MVPSELVTLDKANTAAERFAGRFVLPAGKARDYLDADKARQQPWYTSLVHGVLFFNPLSGPIGRTVGPDVARGSSVQLDDVEPSVAEAVLPRGRTSPHSSSGGACRCAEDRQRSLDGTPPHSIRARVAFPTLRPPRHGIRGRGRRPETAPTVAPSGWKFPTLGVGSRTCREQRSVGDGLVPSRCQGSRYFRHGRPQGSPLRFDVANQRVGDSISSRDCGGSVRRSPVPPTASRSRLRRLPPERVSGRSGCGLGRYPPRRRPMGESVRAACRR